MATPFFSSTKQNTNNSFIDYEHNMNYNKLTEGKKFFSNIALGASKKISVYYVKAS